MNISLSIVCEEFTPAVLGPNTVHGCKSCIHFTVDDFTDTCALRLVCFNSIGDYSFISYFIGDTKPQMVKTFRDILRLRIQHRTFCTQYIAVNEPLKFVNIYEDEAVFRQGLPPVSRTKINFLPGISN